jgi:hypothetical protein
VAREQPQESGQKSLDRGELEAVPTEREVLQSFVEDRLEFRAGAKSRWRELVAAFQEYAKAGGWPGKLSTSATAALSSELRQRECLRRGKGDERVWEGVELK